MAGEFRKGVPKVYINNSGIVTDMSTMERWLQFGKELKAMRERIISDNGYWLPIDLSSDGLPKWIELTDETKAKLMEGEKPSFPPTTLLDPCPKCKRIEHKAHLVQWLHVASNCSVRIWHSDAITCVIEFSNISNEYRLGKRYIQLLRAARLKVMTYRTLLS